MIEAIRQADWASVGPWMMLGAVVLLSVAIIHTHLWDKRKRAAEDAALVRITNEWRSAAAGGAFERWNHNRDRALTLPEPPPHIHTYNCVRSDIVIDDDGTVLMACCVAGCTEIKVYAPGEFVPAPR